MAAVDIWRIDLDDRSGAKPARVLSPDERERAGRFRFERDRVRYVVGRCTLRRILGGLTGVEPGSLEFDYNAAGKPQLRGAGPQFNLSHSGSIGGLAVAETPVGLDVERLRPGFAEEHIAEHFFAPDEVSHLRSLPPHLEELAFFQCWTRKEAFLKATGDGLTLALDSFSVAFGPGIEADLRRSDRDPSETRSWQLTDVSTWFPGCVSAVAHRRGDIPVRFRGDAQTH